MGKSLRSSTQTLAGNHPSLLVPFAACTYDSTLFGTLQWIIHQTLVQSSPIPKATIVPQPLVICFSHWSYWWYNPSLYCMCAPSEEVSKSKLSQMRCTNQLSALARVGCTVICVAENDNITHCFAATSDFFNKWCKCFLIHRKANTFTSLPAIGNGTTKSCISISK